MNPSDPEAAGIFHALVNPLLTWYRTAARDLPWREPNPDPYRVLVSEIMLQQTRVDTVKPYYQRFIAEFPTLRSLAEADEELLLKLWEGLGYYSRAKNLQKAARKLAAEYGGRLPAAREQLLNLPGIGEYTAGAIASIAFGLPEPAVDGNVIRVCFRLLDCQANPTDPRLREDVRQRLKKVYPKEHCSEFTQSLMELGAMICLPGHPRCPECPLREICLGQQTGNAAILPLKKVQIPRRIERKTVFLLQTKQGKLALRKRPSEGLLAGLWEYPSAPGFLTLPQIRQWLSEHRIAAENIRPCGSAKHIFTHLEWHMRARQIRCESETPEYVWVTPEELERKYSLPSAFRKFALE